MMCTCVAICFQGASRLPHRRHSWLALHADSVKCPFGHATCYVFSTHSKHGGHRVFNNSKENSQIHAWRLANH